MMRDDSQQLHLYTCMSMNCSFYPVIHRLSSVQGYLHRFASACMKRLSRIIEKQELVQPSADEMEHSRVGI